MSVNLSFTSNEEDFSATRCMERNVIVTSALAKNLSSSYTNPSTLQNPYCYKDRRCSEGSPTRLKINTKSLRSHIHQNGICSQINSPSHINNGILRTSSLDSKSFQKLKKQRNLLEEQKFQVLVKPPSLESFKLSKSENNTRNLSNGVVLRPHGGVNLNDFDQTFANCDEENRIPNSPLTLQPNSNSTNQSNSIRPRQLRITSVPISLSGNKLCSPSQQRKYFTLNSPSKTFRTKDNSQKSKKANPTNSIETELKRVLPSKEEITLSKLPPKSPQRNSGEGGNSNSQRSPNLRTSFSRKKGGVGWKPVQDMMTNHQYEGHYHDDSSSEDGNKFEVDASYKCPRMKSFDEVVFDVLKVHPEKFAQQLTILDFPIFCAIRPDEITSCGWASKEKSKLSPNVVAMTRRFNHTSFWVIREILNAGTLKSRAEILCHFIKIAKKLYELNNLHSLMAVIQSLNSSSIFRLTKTWALINKHHKQTFDRLLYLVREDGNRNELRMHMDAIKLPCIPYLGMYLTDVMYINSAHPDTGGLESHERTSKMNNILRMMSEYQQSDYSHLEDAPHIKNYLTSVKYIVELQKFLEEDNYKMSLKIEPTQTQQRQQQQRQQQIQTPEKRSSRSKDEPFLGKNPNKLDGGLNRHSTQTPPAQQRFIPGHRKSRSLGREFAFTGSHPSTSRPRPESNKILKRRSLYGRPKKDCTVWYLSPVRMPYNSGSLPRASVPPATVALTTSLLDDSIIATPASLASSSSSNTRITSGNSGSIGSSRSNSGSEFSEHDEVSWSSERASDISQLELGTCQFEGCLKRKCVLKRGRKPAISGWTKYWVALCGTQLVYYTAKSMRSHLDRQHFKARPSKAVSIRGWMVLYSEDPSKMDSFQISDPNCGNIYRFECDSKEVALVWINNLKEAMKGYPQPEQDLINLDDS